MMNTIKPYVVRTFDGNGCETYRKRFKSEDSAMKAASSMSKTQHIIEYDTVSGDCTNGDIAEIKPEYRIIRDMRRFRDSMKSGMTDAAFYGIID